jgi:transcriptional regulator with XRE-family HTH domain
MMTPVRLRVRELREAQKISQVELAERAGIRRATLSAIETGQTTGIDFDTLERLARVLGVDAAFLIVQEHARTIHDSTGREWICQQTARGRIGWRRVGSGLPSSADLAGLHCKCGRLAVRFAASPQWRELPESALRELLEKQLRKRDGK